MTEPFPGTTVQPLAAARLRSTKRIFGITAQSGRPAAPLLMSRIFSGDNNVNSIRLLLALMVLWSHSFAFYLDDEGREPIARLTRGLYNAGNIGVASFLILSGALVLRSWESSRSVRSFVEKRVRRLYPAYLVAVFIGAFVIAPAYAGLDPVSLLRTYFPDWLIANLMLRGYAPVSDVFVNSPIHAMNGSLWSIFYEGLCYIGLMIAAATLRARLGAGCWIALAVAVGAKVFADLTGWNPGFGVIGRMFGWPYLWFSVGSWFVTGMLFYLYRDRIPRRASLLMASAAIWLAAIWLPAETYVARLLMDVAFTPTLAYMLFHACSAAQLPVEHRMREFDLSYGMYLYAFPIQQIILAETGHSFSFMAYVGLSTLFTGAAAAISWLAIEKRFLARR